jgi:hypothetical protein
MLYMFSVSWLEIHLDAVASELYFIHQPLLSFRVKLPTTSKAATFST